VATLAPGSAACNCSWLLSCLPLQPTHSRNHSLLPVYTPCIEHAGRCIGPWQQSEGPGTTENTCWYLRMCESVNVVLEVRQGWQVNQPLHMCTLGSQNGWSTGCIAGEMVHCLLSPAGMTWEVQALRRQCPHKQWNMVAVDGVSMLVVQNTW
jgi:hypothetical protein